MTVYLQNVASKQPRNELPKVSLKWGTELLPAPTGVDLPRTHRSGRARAPDRGRQPRARRQGRDLEPSENPLPYSKHVRRYVFIYIDAHYSPMKKRIMLW